MIVTISSSLEDRDSKSEGRKGILSLVPEMLLTDPHSKFALLMFGGIHGDWRIASGKFVMTAKCMPFRPA